MKKKTSARRARAGSFEKDNAGIGEKSDDNDSDDAVLVLPKTTGRKRRERPVDNEASTKTKRKKKDTTTKTALPSTTSAASSFNDLKGASNLSSLPGPSPLQTRSQRMDRLMQRTTKKHEKDAIHLLDGVLQRPGEDMDNGNDEIRPLRQGRRCKQDLEGDEEEVELVMRPKRLKQDVEDALEEIEPVTKPESRTQDVEDDEEKEVNIFVIESDAEETDSLTATAFKYKDLHGRSRTVTHRDLNSITSQPASLVTIDALLWMCTESLRRYYSREGHLFVYDLTLVHSFMTPGAHRRDVDSLLAAKPFWDDIFGHEITLLVPLHSDFHYSLAVVEAIDSATQCFSSGNCTCETQNKHINIFHYDSLGKKSSHKDHVVFKAVTDWLYMGATKLGFCISSATFADHFRINKIEECDGDQKTGDLTCSVFTALYGASVISGSSLSSERGKANIVIETITTKLKQTALLETRKYAGKDIPDYVRSSQQDNYYRLPLEDVEQGMSTADVMQIANWKIDESLREMWGIEGLHYLSRLERRKKDLKVDFRDRHKDCVRKGAKLAAKKKKGCRVPTLVMDMAMGGLWNAADCSYPLAGKDLSERVFIGMRSYPDSHINFRTPSLLFITNTCRKIELQQTDRVRTAPTLHTNLRQLLVVYGVDVLNRVKLAPKFSPEARTIMQEISMHIVAVVEYVLQCTQAALEKHSVEFEAKENLLSLLQCVKIADQPEILHKAARKALRTNICNPGSEPGLEVYNIMEAALKIAKEAMSACGRTIVTEWRMYVRNEEGKSQIVRMKRAPVQPSFLEQFPSSVFTELYRAMWPEISRRIKTDPGQGIKREILRICNLANEIFVSVRASDTAPSHRTLSVFIDRNETAARIGRPPKSSRPPQSTGLRSQLQPVSVPDGTTQPVAVTSTNRLGLNLRFHDRSSYVYALSRTGNSMAVTFTSCVFRVLFSILNQRHMRGRDCENGCDRAVIQVLDKDIGLILKAGAPGWITETQTGFQDYWAKRLQETVVKSCITAASVPNFCCLEAYNCTDRTGAGSFGPSVQLKIGGHTEWRGNVQQFITVENVTAPYWHHGNCIGIGPIRFPSRVYGNNSSFMEANCIFSAEITYKLEYSNDNENVAMVNCDGRRIAFYAMDVVRLHFMDACRRILSAKFAIVMRKPSLDKHSTVMGTELHVLDDTAAQWRSEASITDLVRSFHESQSKRATRRGKCTEVRIFKVGLEGLSRHFSIFQAVASDLPRINPTFQLGFSSIRSLIERQFNSFADIVTLHLQHQIYSPVSGSLNKEPPLTQAITTGFWSTRIMNQARQKMKDFAVRSSTTVNDSQLDFLASWASMAAAYFSLDYRYRTDAHDSEQNESGGSDFCKFGRRVFFCQGPPGTGKSYTVSLLIRAVTSRILEEFQPSARYGVSSSSDLTGRVLVLTVTNAALDDLFCNYWDRIGRNAPDTSVPVRIGLNSTRARVKRREVSKLAASSREDGSESEYLANMKVIFSTVGTALTYDWNEGGPFDAIIIDEAAHSDETEVSAVISRLLHTLREPKHGTTIVMVGDHMQLPPFDDKKFKSWTESRHPKKHYFARALSAIPVKLASPLAEKYQVDGMWGNIPSFVFQFDTQMRSAASIGSIVSSLFYENRIQNGIRPANREWIRADRMRNLVSEQFPLSVVNIVDTQQTLGIGMTLNQEVQSKFGGYCNPFEVSIVVDMVVQWKSLHTGGKIGILTPYNAQKREMEAALHAKRIFPDQVPVRTFDSSQGMEFDVVLISLVRTKTVKEHPSGPGKLQFLENKHAACVALSRAREVIIVIGKCTTIVKGAPLWHEYLKELRKGSRHGNADFAYLEPSYVSSRRGANVLHLVEKTSPSSLF